MLRCVHRSRLHSCRLSQIQALWPPSISGTSKGNICAETWGQHMKGREHLIPSQQLLPWMRPMSSAASSEVRSKGNSRNMKAKPHQEPPVIPNTRLPPNLKLAVGVEELLEKGAEPSPDDAQEVVGGQDEDGRLGKDGDALVLSEQHLERTAASGTEVGVMSWLQGGIVTTRSLDPQVFGVPLRRDVVHEVIRWQLAKRRVGNAKTKRIGEVSGSGRKVRPQKKQGIARAGHSRPPHWRGGAKAHGPRPRDWSFKLNKKFVKLGLRVALSARLREGRLKVVDALTSDTFKTSALLNTMEARGVDNSVLFIDKDFPKPEFMKSTNNIFGVKVLPSRGANVYDVVKRTDLVITEAGVSHLEEVLRPT